MNQKELVKLHKCAIYNREKIEKTDLCGCFYCKHTFPPENIKEWTDERKTAICPYCGVDAVICNDSNYKITKEDLETLNEYYFR